MNIYNIDYPFSPIDTYPLTLNRSLLTAFIYSGFSLFSEIFLSLLMPYSLLVWILSPSLNCPFAVFSFFSQSITLLNPHWPWFCFLRSPLLSRSLSPLRLFDLPLLDLCRALSVVDKCLYPETFLPLASLNPTTILPTLFLYFLSLLPPFFSFLPAYILRPAVKWVLFLC